MSFDKKKIIWLVFALIFGVGIWVVYSVFFQKIKIPEGTAVDIYFYNTTSRKIEPEKRGLQEKTNEAMVQEVAEILRTGPKSTAFLPTVPATVTFDSLELDKQILNITFSEEYTNMNTLERLFLKSSVVWSFTSLPFISDVWIQNENVAEPVLLNRSNVVLDEAIEPTKKQRQWITLYFPNFKKQKLVPQNRLVTIESENKKMSQNVMHYLLGGPENDENLSKIFIEDVKLIKVETYEGICYVDFGQDFESKISTDPTIERLQLYAVVNSLMDLNQVKEVQFLVEGQVPQNYKGTIDISKPLVSDETLNEKE